MEFAGEDSDYTLSMVLNDDYHATDWYKVNVSGEGADYAKLAVSDEGYVLTSDGLSEGIYINAANRQVSVSLGIMTDCNSILIYEIDENTIGIRLDTDGDGVYETDYEPDYLGDYNLDGTVDSADLASLQQYLISHTIIDVKQHIAIDINMDGVVDTFDIAILRQNLLS
ncbi:MAG: dockerin type I repeat-containing protein [Ruminococcus sp.]|nr:dockerin type I repeat-containing protein [Ruminococcus sp.]